MAADSLDRFVVWMHDSPRVVSFPLGTDSPKWLEKKRLGFAQTLLCWIFLSGCPSAVLCNDVAVNKLRLVQHEKKNGIRDIVRIAAIKRAKVTELSFYKRIKPVMPVMMDPGAITFARILPFSGHKRLRCFSSGQ